jgi:hypothetical protein
MGISELIVLFVVFIGVRHSKYSYIKAMSLCCPGVTLSPATKSIVRNDRGLDMPAMALQRPRTRLRC